MSTEEAERKASASPDRNRLRLVTARVTTRCGGLTMPRPSQARSQDMGARLHKCDAASLSLHNNPDCILGEKAKGKPSMLNPMISCCSKLTSLAVLAALLIAGASQTASARGLSVEDILRAENVGYLEFSPTGHTAVFERYREHASSENFTNSGPWGHSRIELHIWNARDGKVERLFPDDPAGYVLGAFSPSGRYVSYLRLRDEKYTLGVWDTVERRRTDFNVSVDPGKGIPLWISEHQLLGVQVAAGQVAGALMFSIQGADGAVGDVGRLINLWNAANAGDRSTAVMNGSGRYSDAGPDVRVAGLFVADLRSGNHQLIQKGDFTQVSLSPDSRKIAAVRVKDRQSGILAHVTGLHRDRTFSPVRESDVLILETSNPTRSARVSCTQCSVVFGDVTWSPKANQLAFEAGDSFERSGLFIYNLSTKRVASANTGRTAFKTGSLRPTWMGSALMAAIPNADGTAAEWAFVSKSEAPRRTGIRSVAHLYPVLDGSAGFIVRDGNELWFRKGRARKLLYRSTGAYLQDFSPVGPYLTQNVLALRPSTNARLLFIDRAKGDERSTILSINPNNLEVLKLPAPAGAKVIAAHAPSHRLAYLTNLNRVGQLSISDGQGDHLLTRINRHLETVDFGRSIRIEHAGERGLLTSWLLLPQGFEGEGKLPTIVYQYPERNFVDPLQLEFSESFLDVRLLASRGYAVLFASTTNFRGERWDLSLSLVKDTDRAVDAAISTGFVDPDRLAMMGHSNGGFATAMIVSKTDRYKAAVAMSGAYNYVGMTAFAGYISPRQMNEHPWFHMAKSIFGIDPPWVDAEKDWYVNNTLLFSVDKIKTPLFIVHADLEHVSLSGAQELFMSLRWLGKDVLFTRYAGETHQYQSPANIRDMWQRIFDWYGTYLGPDLRGERPSGVAFASE